MVSSEEDDEHLKKERQIHSLFPVRKKTSKAGGRINKKTLTSQTTFNYVHLKIVTAFLIDRVHKLMNFYEVRRFFSGYPVWRSKTAAYVQCGCLLLPCSITDRMMLEVLLECSSLNCQLKEEDFLNLSLCGFCCFLKK